MRQTASAYTAIAAVAVTVLWGGGFDPAPQWTFAGLAVLSAGLAAPRRWSAPALVLLALAALGALSAAWTIGPAGAALRWSALSLGYAALAVAAPAWAVETIAGAAAVTGLFGLVSAAALSTSFAERLDGGSWRPEGTFGYPPALALVQVFALPALLVWAARGRAWAASGLAIAAGVIALDGNRLGVALAVLVALLALAVPVAPRPALAAALVLACAAGLAIHEAAGGWHPRHAERSWWAVAAVVATVVLATPAWSLLRPRLPAEIRISLHLPRTAVVVAAVAVAVGVALGTAAALDTRRFPSHQGFAHGRTWMWEAGWDAAARRPLAGHGADTFQIATILDQPGRGRQTRYAHDLPLELWVELGLAGLALGIGLYTASARALWQSRGTPALWLAGPAVAAFLVSNTVDWTWHLAGVGALFALALGALPEPRPTSS